MSELPSWDLSGMYSAIDDPRLESEVAGLRARAEQFSAAFRGAIAAPGLSPQDLLRALGEFEEIHRLLRRPQAYSQLVYSADSRDPRHGALVQRLLERVTEIRNTLLFFELELCAMPEAEFQRLAGDPLLAPYRHYLEKERALRPYRLSEPEERILEEKANSGARSFIRLFDETLANHEFEVEIDREVQRLPEARVLALLFEPDRETRRAAAEGLTAGLRQHSRALGLTFNSLLLDRAIDDRLRGFPYPEAARHLENELTREVVDRVVEACVAGYPLVADYYRLKGRLLGIEPLTHYDRYAPLAEKAATIDYDQAAAMVLDAFGAFAPEARAAAEPFFSARRIDAAVRPGKQGGGFCCSIDAEVAPFVFMNYTQRPRDVMTLAHELGHGIHGCLAQRQSFLNYHAVLPLAETASVFGEMLVFDRMMRRLPDPKERLAFLCEKIEDTFGTTFRQIALYRFEQAVHRARREQGELSLEAVNALWQEATQEMYGESVVLGEDHAWWWLYIPHFLHTPFYVYAYAVGELLVLSLYARYRQEGSAFVPRYLELLAAGGSRRPEELLADLGIDLQDRAFWGGGVALIGDYVRQAHALAEAV